MKKIIALMVAVACMATMTITSFAQGEKVSVKLDGVVLGFDENPFIENDRTLVPLRKIFESVGANVTWDDETRTAIATRSKDDMFTVIAIQSGSEIGFVNAQQKKIDIPAKIVGDRVFVPLRFVIESLGENVEWDGENRTVIITTK